MVYRVNITYNGVHEGFVVFRGCMAMWASYVK